MELRGLVCNELSINKNTIFFQRIPADIADLRISDINNLQ